jgi:hypothetical protein
MEYAHNHKALYRAMEKMMDVRCCCNPGKLIGTVPDFPELKSDYVQTRSYFIGTRVALPTKDGTKVEVEVACCFLRDGDGPAKPTIAIKSNDLPVEYYKKIEGFVEA